MLGGNVIGEESRGMLNAQSSFSKQHFIYLNEIERVIVIDNQMVLVMKN
jgi:hypothetical protein